MRSNVFCGAKVTCSDFAALAIKCDLHHLPVLPIRLAVIVNGLNAHVTLVGVVVQRQAELAFLGRKFLHDLVRRFGRSRGIDGTKALIGLVLRLGRQR